MLYIACSNHALTSMPNEQRQTPVTFYFGDPWPSDICDGGEPIQTPVGTKCILCQEIILDGDQGTFYGMVSMQFGDTVVNTGSNPVHKECSLRAVVGGIGHLENHEHWCLKVGDPDAICSYRNSSLMVWDWVQAHGMPVG